MWCARFWNPRMFAERYWTKVGEDPPPPTPGNGTARNNPMVVYPARLMNR